MRRAIFGACLAALAVKLFVFEPFVADGNSMEPTIRNGGILLVNKIRYGIRMPGSSGYLIRWGAPRYGDVVVFRNPSGTMAVKRSLGTEGDGTVTVRGDNPLSSYDSRSYGPIPADTVIGKVLGVR